MLCLEFLLMLAYAVATSTGSYLYVAGNKATHVVACLVLTPDSSRTRASRRRHPRKKDQSLAFSSSVLQQISSNGRHPLPLEYHGLVDQIS